MNVYNIILLKLLLLSCLLITLTSLPSSQPTSTPSSHPSRQPSSQPTNPTSQPSIQPSSSPSLQPSSLPSSLPTQWCSPGHYKINETCYSCPIGYAGTGHTNNCTSCISGKYASTLTGICELCPIGTYSSNDNSLECIKCDKGTITFLEGSTSSLQCISPLANIFFSMISLAILLLIVLIYIIRGRFFRIGFIRHERIVLILIKRLRDLSLVFSIQAKEYYDNKEDENQGLRETFITNNIINKTLIMKFKSFFKVLLYFFILILILPLALVTQLYALVATILFKSLLIFKGVRIYVKYTYIEQIKKFLHIIAFDYLALPPLLYLFEPLIEFFN